MKLLTFDIEDWFHILDHPLNEDHKNWGQIESRLEQNVDTILCLLSETTSSATFFCLGWVAEKYPWLIRRIADAGYHIACHSFHHQLVFNQSKSVFREDIRRAKVTLENVSGQPIDTYRAPGFSITDRNLWALEILHEEGYECDCSLFNAVRYHGGVEGIKVDCPTIIRTSAGGELKELPLSVTRVFGRNMVSTGGGYFRLTPVVINNFLVSHSHYVMTYFHPRDFDYGQPRLPNLSMIRSFRYYYGLNRTEKKLRYMLQKHNFVDIKSACQAIDWGKVQSVDL